MHEKELRLALVCYGGISLAVYMHGITKEIWHLVRASRARADGTPPVTPSEAVYITLLNEMEARADVRVRVLADIVAGGASAVIAFAGAGEAPYLLGDAVHVDGKADPSVADQRQAKFLLPHREEPGSMNLRSREGLLRCRSTQS